MGSAKVVANCVRILRRHNVDEETLLVLAGPSAAEVLRGKEGGVSGYWPRVWAMRGLLYAWDDAASSVVIAAANDESWRVREMCAKVVARRGVVDAFDAMAELGNDPVVRVRKAAERALVRLVESET
ncbi:MAG TPA: HEAT repeat domain-containing protein [Acidimicrobiales bacterium]|nr:HEAT repeat domain-containing protein [Acidimicrobiales bacterium]